MAARVTRARGVGGDLSEEAFRAQVEGLARFYGWLIYHAPDKRPSGRTGRVQRVTRGFPDEVLVRGPELLVVELKAERGRLGPGQQEWLDAFGVVSAAVAALVAAVDGIGLAPNVERPAVEAYLWRPSDWDAIEERLARGRSRAHVPAPV